MNEEVITLLPKRKTGILRIIFSRASIIMVLLVLEVFIMAAIYGWFSEFFKLFTIVQSLFSMTMIVYLFNCDMDATAKLTWLYLIMFFPVPATILLWWSKRDIGHNVAKWRIEHLIQETKDLLSANKDTIDQPILKESGTDDLCRYLNRTGCFPIYTNTDVTYLPSGEAKFEALLQELNKAQQFIYLEYFIIDEGYMWGRILKVLEQKASEGVDVRVIYDGMCEVALLTHDYPKRLAKLGIKAKPFIPITPFISTQYNYRDHRKIAVIDGKVAFNGGINLADEYINRITRFGHWKDTAVMLKGEAVQSFTLMFLQMWNIDVTVTDWSTAKICENQPSATGFVLPFADCPLDNDKVGENVYMDILYRARSYVHIMTPYLILDNEIEAAIKYAAQRGIDVKIILPAVPDKKAAYALAVTHFASLMESGVKIYEYTPGFVHAKVFVSDDEKAVVGTINLDYRSLYHHFECATYLYQTPCVLDIEKDVCDTLEQCRELTLEIIKKEKLFYRILGGLLKVLAPLL